MTKSELKSILVGTSLEQASDPVVRTGFELARRSGATLHVFHAHALPVAYFAAPTGLTTVSSDLMESERQVRRQLLEQQLERLGLGLDDVGGTVIEAGAAHRMLLRTAKNVDADLIVLGASEGDGLHILGSTADRVLRQAEVPVWVVDGRPRVPPQKVLAPVDLSRLSEESLRRGLAILDAVGLDAVGLDAVGDERPSIESLFVLTPEEVEGSHQFKPEQIRRLASEELDSFLERVDPEGRRGIEPEVREGDIRAEILRDIEEKPIDLVVLGTHGRNGFERFILGSVASDVAARAQVSALVIPPEKGKEEPEKGKEEE